MKWYHLVWLSFVSTIVMFVAMVFMGLSLVFPALRLPGDAVIVLSGAGISLLGSAALVFGIKGGMEAGYLKRPEGGPVDPSEIWVDPDMPLGIGSRVLAYRGDISGHKGWYRGIVVRVKKRDRFLVRFVGWPAFWDEVHYRKDLQVDPSDLDGGTSTAVRDATAITNLDKPGSEITHAIAPAESGLSPDPAGPAKAANSSISTHSS
jgi:hypothetical protein